MSSSADKAAREQILQEVVREIRGFVLKRYPQWADDIAQESLLKIHTKYPHVYERDQLVRVGVTIAHFKIFEYRRREKGNKIQIEKEFDIPVSTGLSAEERLLQQAEVQRILACISRLGEDCQKIMRMMLAGKKAAEIQEALGIVEPGAYATRLCRCRKKLKELMGWSV